MDDDFYLLKKSFNSKLECPVNAGLCMASRQFLFVAVLAASFGCNQQLFMRALEYSHLKWSILVMLFDCNLSRHPILGQFIDLDLLLCTGFRLEHLDLF